jgi:hypothetical protein
MNILLIFGLGLLVIVNGIVTIAVCRSESYEPMQKRLQLFVIWLVPIIGSAFLWYVMREDSRSDFRSGDGHPVDFGGDSGYDGGDSGCDSGGSSD